MSQSIDPHSVAIPPDRSAPVIRVPVAVAGLVARLEAAGFETWCVGGAVRDALLGEGDLDWDIATAALPADVQRLFRRTVPVGIEHGTVGVFGDDGRLHEVTTFRADVETDGRHAVVRFGVSLEDDLARRDFTINAMAWSPSRQVLNDPFGGRDDLEARVVRAVGDPVQRMAEDRLRALRAIRFAARFGFAIDDATWSAIRGSASDLTRLSMERVLQEWTKTLTQVQCPSDAFARWRDAGAIASVLPSLDAVPTEFFDAIDHVPPPWRTSRPERQTLRTMTRLALPFVALGSIGAQSAMTALRASKHDAGFAASVAASWADVGTTVAAHAREATPDAASLRRAVARIGRTRVHGTLRVFSALWAAQRARGIAAPSSAEVCRLARRMLRMAFTDPIALGDLVVGGNDLRRVGLRPGPALGHVLQRLLEAVIEDPSLNTEATLLAMAARMNAEG